jgi:hypothetical protein
MVTTEHRPSLREVHRPPKKGRRFVVTLQPLPNVDPIRSLRWALKGLLRRHGMRCVDLNEEEELTDA